GCPIIFGPRMENFREIADDLIKVEGAVRIQDEADLSGKLAELLSNPESRKLMGKRTRQLVETRQGASRRNLKLIGDIIIHNNG
ncbi:MAG: 3-deoxy-D-manno-octulosonic acid transferase, partial [Candidatus Auribacterota bacterium]|nr:3-deoxy-D-manno-octulosonic acid transferase [Candidatus Auribacterota bacterium]